MFYTDFVRPKFKEGWQVGLPNEDRQVHLMMMVACLVSKLASEISPHLLFRLDVVIFILLVVVED